jgi:hypothetical protein
VAQVQGGQLKVVHPETAATASPVYPVPAWPQRS